MAETENDHSFDLGKVAHHFAQSKTEEDEINLDGYIEGYTELCKFFNLLGSVFSFILSDVHEKLGILRQYRSCEKASEYITVQSMIKYEVENDLTAAKTKPLSGSRTLLRLHRALDFLVLFMKKIKEAEASEKTSHLAQNAYTDTLANFHPWIIRKAAGVALYALPTREQLLVQMGGADEKTTVAKIEETIKSIKPVYDITQKLYDDKNLHDLP